MKWLDFIKTDQFKEHRADMKVMTEIPDSDHDSKMKEIPAMQIKAFVAKMDEGVEENETLAIISTETMDRYGDIVRAKGGDFKAWRKNPVVLWGHNHSILPIAKGMWVKAEDLDVKSKYTFAQTAFAQEVKQLEKDGFLQAHSIGFMPVDAEWIVDENGEKTWGIDFKKWELLEFSVVNVPANKEALAVAIGKGAVKMCDELKKDLLPDAPKITFGPVAGKDCPDCDAKFTPEDGCLERCAVCQRKKDEPKCIQCSEEKEDTFYVCGKKHIHASCLEKLLDGCPTKAGAVLNKKNKDALKAAQDKIQTVLDSATSDDDDDKGASDLDIKGVAAAMDAGLQSITNRLDAMDNHIQGQNVKIKELSEKTSETPVARVEETASSAVIDGLVKESLERLKGKVLR